jgi:hypothetical protein
MPGETTARGYGWSHQKTREYWVRAVAAGGVTCARCGEVLESGAAFDLDHDDDDRSRYLGASHPWCNRATHGRRSEPPRRTSRVW